VAAPGSGWRSWGRGAGCEPKPPVVLAAGAFNRGCALATRVCRCSSARCARTANGLGAGDDCPSLLSDCAELGGYELEESSMEGCGVEPDKCSRSKRSSLDSIAASRAFSFYGLRPTASTAARSLSSAARCSAPSRIAALSCRLLDANLLFYGRRQGGSDARNSCLLR
jgi:hypothetical protein